MHTAGDASAPSSRSLRAVFSAKCLVPATTALQPESGPDSLLSDLSPRCMAAVSPKQLIDEYLLKEVKVALLSKDLTIQEVAYRYGFTSQSHFTKFFRKLTGETPTEYKKSSL